MRQQSSQSYLRPMTADHANNRDSYVDTARGIFCILLVLYHVVVFDAPEGLNLKGTSIWHVIVDALIYVRMPLFAFVSGYVYGGRPILSGGKQFVLGKMRRLLLPMLVANTGFVLILVHGVHGKVWNWNDLLLIVSPYYNYWFLEALFIIFVVTLVLEKLGLLANGFRFLIVWAGSIAAQRWIIVPGIFNFNLNGAIYIFPYFLCGLACIRFRIKGNYFFISALAVFVSTMLLVVAGLLGYFHVAGRISTMSLLLGISGAYLVVVELEWRNEVLMSIGRSSYAIFLYHMFFTSATWFLAYSFHVHGINTLVVMLTIGGIVGPLLADKIIRRFAIARTVLLGERWTASSSDKRSASAVALG